MSIVIDEMVTFRGLHHAESESTKSFCALVECVNGGWSNRQWFTYKKCSYEIIELVMWITAPKWLLEKKGIMDLIIKKE